MRGTEVRVRDDTLPSERGLRVALIFALAAHRLSAHYDHGLWLTDAQATSLAADWLARSKNKLPLAERRHLAALSDQFARRIAATLSREAGLYTAHEMTEALDPNHRSELAQTMLSACEGLLDDSEGTGD